MIIPPNASFIFAFVVICFRNLNYEKREVKNEKIFTSLGHA